MKRQHLSTPYMTTRPESVDAEKGIVFGVSVVTAGEAKGHGVSLDESFVDDVIRMGNAAGEKGVLSRYGHETMCSTALGKFIGRAKNFRKVATEAGPAAKADLYLSQTAKLAQGGDGHGNVVNLWDYVLEMAQKEPDACGMSIVFSVGGRYKKDPQGARVDYPQFDENVTPKDRDDQRRKYDAIEGPEFVSVEALHFADLVDQPAANDGLFSAFHQGSLAVQVAEFLDTHPRVIEMLDKPEVVAEFIGRYNDSRTRRGLPAVQILGVSVEPEKPAVEPEKPADPEKKESVPADGSAPTDGKNTTTEPAPAAPPAVPPAQTEAHSQPALPATALAADPRDELRRFVEAFGNPNGQAWWMDGISFDEAQKRHVAFVAEENNRLRDQVAELTKATRAAPGAEPVSFSEAPSDRNNNQSANTARRDALATVMAPTLAAFAASLKFAKGN